MRLYELLMHSQSITLCRWRPAVSLLGEGGRKFCIERQHCTAADGASRMTILATNAYQYSSNFTSNLEFFHCFSLPLDNPIHYIFLIHSPFVHNYARSRNKCNKQLSGRKQWWWRNPKFSVQLKGY